MVYDLATWKYGFKLSDSNGVQGAAVNVRISFTEYGNSDSIEHCTPRIPCSEPSPGRKYSSRFLKRQAHVGVM